MLKSPFSQDPTILWTKIACPMCGEPTGKQSRCFESPIAQKLEAYQCRIDHPKLGIIPVFSQGCAFRNENLWQAELNYPVSEALLLEFKKISGVERISVTKSYTFQVSIASCFEERKIKSDISTAYKSFIKSLSVDWTNLHTVTKTDNLIGVEFPNGHKFLIDENSDVSSQLNVLDTILKEIPGSLPISQKKLEK